jgi:hypothetical protein
VYGVFFRFGFESESDDDRSQGDSDGEKEQDDDHIEENAEGSVSGGSDNDLHLDDDDAEEFYRQPKKHYPPCGRVVQKQGNDLTSERRERDCRRSDDERY